MTTVTVKDFVELKKRLDEMSVPSDDRWVLFHGYDHFCKMWMKLFNEAPPSREILAEKLGVSKEDL